MPDDPHGYALDSRLARLEESVSALEKLLGRVETHLERRIDERIQSAVEKIEERYSLIRMAVLALFSLIAAAFLQYLIAGWKEPRPSSLWAPPPYHSTNEIKEQRRP